MVFQNVVTGGMNCTPRNSASHLAQIGKPVLLERTACVNPCSGFVLQLVLEWAKEMELVGRNVADVDAAKPPIAIHAEAKGLLIEEVQRLLTATSDDRFDPLWRFDLATALRRGEIIQLHWTDIDLAARKMLVRASASYAFGEVTVKPPKSGRIRAIELSDLALAALKSGKVQRAKDKLRGEGCVR
jgi:integrase